MWADGAMVDMVSPLASCGSTVRVDQVKIPIMSTAIQRERVVLTFAKIITPFFAKLSLQKVSTTQILQELTISFILTIVNYGKSNRNMVKQEVY